MKRVVSTRSSNERHWVGDGFPVRTIFSYSDIAKTVSPFLLLDYAGPAQFPPSDHARGVGEHPHRGFETVTIVFSGEVDHRDSSGGGGSIGPGDVQWMTAASGLVHEEKHGKEFTQHGGAFEIVQLWVNLPAKYKMAAPRYQGLRDADFPRFELPNGAGFVRVIAGALGETHGPARTFTPIELWDVRLNANGRARFSLPAGHTATVFVLSGKVEIGDRVLDDATLAVLDKEETDLELTALADSKLLVLAGEPIDEPIVGYGPFVMNTREEIQQAFVDFQSGKMGKVSAEG
jgi:redox-sensitive bicupin YhaK (pirin superfamily)